MVIPSTGMRKRESGESPELPRSGKQVRKPYAAGDTGSASDWEVWASRCEPVKSEDLPWEHSLAPPRGGEVAAHPPTIWGAVSSQQL